MSDNKNSIQSSKYPQSFAALKLSHRFVLYSILLCQNEKTVNVVPSHDDTKKYIYAQLNYSQTYL